MVPRLAATVALLFAATALYAQDKVRIEFEGEGSREVWIQEKGKESALPQRTAVSGKAIELDLPEDKADKLVFVHDTATGDVAVKPLADVIKSGKWLVKASEATHAFLVAFLVQHEGKPVSAAVVHMNDREQLVTGADEGMAAFHIVLFGDVNVSVDYESEGEDKALASQVFEAKSGMAKEAPFVLTITDTVETIAPATEEAPKTSGEGDEKEGATKEDKEKEEPAKTNPFLTVFNMLIGLLIIGGISYGIWRYVKANPDKTADVLGKAGVPIPGDPGSVTSHVPKKAGPPQQIILGDAAPTPADTTVAVAAAPMVKNPRLVKSDGTLFLVQDGTQSVGRDDARELPLPNESSVSRTHAKLTRSGDSVTVEDAGSTNGTFVNGHKVTSPTALYPGDTVQFGAVQFRYEE